MRIWYSTRAQSDVEGILIYIARDNPAAAEKGRRAIVAAVKTVAGNPYLGIKNARNPNLRSHLLGRYPYRIHYVVRDQELIVLHVRHGARKPWAGK